MSFSYFNEDVSLPKFKKRIISAWIKHTILTEGKILGDITFVFCSDNYLLDINRQYLNHDFYTDIITFDYVENNTISGDIFISTERVKENSSKFNTSFENELNRIMIHGVLHLIGYKDKNAKDKKLMSEKEDFYLDVFRNSF